MPAKTSTKTSTADKILDVGRRLFNARGFAATSLSDIATAVGISKGNLSYHFPTKRDLAIRLREDTIQQMRDRRLNLKPGEVAEDYVRHLLFGMHITWNNRFLLRDRTDFLEPSDDQDSELLADFEELHSLIKRIEAAGFFRRDAVTDLTTLTRSVWIVSRYWMDYLRESEGLQEINWTDQERGVKHHFAVLLPCLTASAKKKFEVALTSGAEKYLLESKS